jgi:hypothetical protein
MRRASRRPSNLSESLHRQLNSYALAAGAAGVAVLALVQPAKAKVIYTRTHFKCYDCNLDLNNDGITDFFFWHSIGCQTSGYGSGFLLRPYAGNGVKGDFHGFALALRRGAKIGGRKHFYYGAEFMAGGLFTSKGKTYATGNWVNATDRYLGLKFQINGHTHYGWARLSVEVKRPGITATLTGYAYETIPNKTIIAGRTHGKDVITVEPASLGHLARGASAIKAWRGRN